MYNKRRILGLGLGLAVFMAQSVFANVTITPLDPPGTHQETNGTNHSNSPSGPDPSQGTNPSPDTGSQPGGNNGWQDSGNSGNQMPRSPLDTGNQTGSQTSGSTGQTQGMAYSGNYSTKSPVSITNGANSGGPDANQTNTSGQNSQAEIAAPTIAAESAILYDVTHDMVLFEKNADARMYPASITKLMTALLVLEHADLDKMVTFSKTAVTKLESGAVTLKLAEGDQVSVRDCLYGLILKSANEVANGLAEHVGGSIQGFADLMNAKAVALGCTNTHFVNPNGLNSSEHYSTCRDMVKIAKAAYENKAFCEISSTLSYTFPKTKNADARTLTPGHKMLNPEDARYYPGIIGGKTGYTSLAGNTLVTCTERDGVRLIAVVMKAKSTHYEDTKAMLDYGYAKTMAGQTGTGQAFHRWIADGNLWYFELADGSRLKGCFATIDGTDYAFDADGRMYTGWKSLDGVWYCFLTNGEMVKNGWMQDAGKWFYLGNDGRMVKNAMIDNQYYVGADGVWVQ